MSSSIQGITRIAAARRGHTGPGTGHAERLHSADDQESQPKRYAPACPAADRGVEGRDARAADDERTERPQPELVDGERQEGGADGDGDAGGR